MIEIPHSADAEQAVLGALLIDPSRLPEVRLLLRPSDFYFSNHSKVYATMLALADAERPIDLLTVSTDTPDVDAGDISRLMDGIPKLVNVVFYAEIVLAKAKERRVLHAVRQFQPNPDDLVGSVAGLAERLTAEVFVDAKSLSTKEMLGTYLDDLEARIAGKKAVDWMPSGFERLDQMIGGFEPCLTVLAARPSIGKSAMALASSAFVARSGGVMFFSLEMDARSLCERLVAMEARVDLLRLRRACPDQGLTDAEWTKLGAGWARVGEMDLVFDCNAGATTDYIAAAVKREQQARKAKGRPPLRMVIVDYLQLLGDDVPRGTDRMAEATRRLHILAQQEKVCVLALSQLRRPEQSKFKDGLPPRANVHDLRESGMIEANAAVILLLERPEHYLLAAGLPVGDYENRAFVSIAKQRNGPVGNITLGFKKPCALFCDPWWTQQEASAQASMFPGED
jgi:replicative DNA helicase